MIPRYANKEISRIWSDENKLQLWQKTELAVIEARSLRGGYNVTPEMYQSIATILRAAPIRIDRWHQLEAESDHDLAAFVDERLEFLTPELQSLFHYGMTSYDTEESAFVKMLDDSVGYLISQAADTLDAIRKLALKHRYTVMMGRTHGQEAELQSFGKRCLTWWVQVDAAITQLERLQKSNLCYSKISGAIGNYGGVSPDIEREALYILGLKPFYGATQIMPREIYLPVAQSVCQLVQSLSKVATDIRLMSRSGRPLCHEPFGKKQKGSSRMPHKKNNIVTERVNGMACAAIGYQSMIQLSVETWEERAINQSCVDRIAWPDLFHVAVQVASVMTKVLKGLQVYPDNMLDEVIHTAGCYASGEAKEFLREHLAPLGISTGDAYRIVQLAAFNVFEPSPARKRLRERTAQSYQVAAVALSDLENSLRTEQRSIQDIIHVGGLHVSPELDASEEQVSAWNHALRELFAKVDMTETWWMLFAPKYLLRHESDLYRHILGEEVSEDQS